jgi:hypothetical protein
VFRCRILAGVAVAAILSSCVISPALAGHGVHFGGGVHAGTFHFNRALYNNSFHAHALHFNNGWRAARGGWGGWGGGWYNDTIIVDPDPIYPVVVAPSPAPAGDLSAWYWCDASGEIASGDANRCVAFYKRLPALPVKVFILDSPGGIVSEAGTIGDDIRGSQIATAVASNHRCSSACFMLFAAGIHRYATPDASIGIHGASGPSRDRWLTELVEPPAETTWRARTGFYRWRD